MWKPFRTHRSPAIVPSCCLAVLLILAGIRSFQQETQAAIAFRHAPEAVMPAEIPSLLWEPAPLRSAILTSMQQEVEKGKGSIPVTGHTVRITGAVGRNTLPDAFIEAGETAELAQAFARMFSLKINMANEPAPGDRFSLLVEKYYREGQFIGYGKILMGRYEKAAGGELLEAVYYEAEQAESGYFDPGGKNLDTLFLIPPVQAARITSSYSLQRAHPILGKMLPHLGIDLAAPQGTPVLAAADGVVVFLGFNGGYGKQIVIEHAGGFRTHYGHLSGYLPGLEAGSQVQQEDVIGYVGSTGLATGPHLDYRLEQGGRFKNPFAAEHKTARDLAPPDLFRMQLQAGIYAVFLETETANRIMVTRELNLTALSSLALPEGAL